MLQLVLKSVVDDCQLLTFIIEWLVNKLLLVPELLNIFIIQILKELAILLIHIAHKHYSLSRAHLRVSLLLVILLIFVFGLFLSLHFRFKAEQGFKTCSCVYQSERLPIVLVDG